ncbi:MAG: class C sortase [Ancrocorticia sp.]
MAYQHPAGISFPPLESHEPNAARQPGAAPSSSKKSLAIPILLQVLAMIGIGAILYSSAADWFATRQHGSQISGYVESVEQLPRADRAAALERARSYNANLPRGVLRDPYLSPSDEGSETSAYADYQENLRIDSNNVMGELSYPRLGISLPIYHGTADDILARGVGHLYGSSLPVGGPSTHSILTSHSGLIHASLFSQLPKAAVRDTFQITVLGERHHYRVTSIETVLPEETESLEIIAGEDHVTLVTCTPIGVNSHRLLVHGERIASPDDDGAGSRSIAGHSAGLPWWILWFVLGTGAIAYILFSPSRPRRDTPSYSSQPVQEVDS